MKKLLYILLFFSALSFGQNRFITRTGELAFEASVPSFEEVAAKNNSVTVIINTDNGEIAALALVTAFRFKNALMEEHFNENYAESERFPKATFKGKFIDFSLDNLSVNSNLFIAGELEFHGTTKGYDNIPVEVEYKNERIVLTGKFDAKASDFNIEIPKIVQSKISDLIQITFNFELVEN